MLHGAEEVRGLAARSDLAAVAQRGEVMSRLAYLLEVYCGAMRGSGPKSQPALLGTVKQIVDPLVRCTFQSRSTCHIPLSLQVAGQRLTTIRSQELQGLAMSMLELGLMS